MGKRKAAQVIQRTQLLGAHACGVEVLAVKRRLCVGQTQVVLQ